MEIIDNEIKTHGKNILREIARDFWLRLLSNNFLHSFNALNLALQTAQSQPRSEKKANEIDHFFMFLIT